GGLARLRLFGELTGDGRAQLGLAWFDRLPGDHALTALAAECGLAGPPAAQLAAGRPYREPDRLDALLSGGGPTGLGARRGPPGPRAHPWLAAGQGAGRPGPPATPGRARSAPRSGGSGT